MNRLGVVAEDLVVKLLRIYGLSILARNVRLRFTELDIVASFGRNLYIFEVRSRRTPLFRKENFDMFINYKKLKKIYKGALLYFLMTKEIYTVNKFQIYIVFVIFTPRIRIKFIRFPDLV